MRVLTPEQSNSYAEKGYAVVAGVFQADELSALDQEIDRLLQGGAQGHHEGWVMSLSRRSELMRSFAADPRILGLIEGIVRPGIAIHSAKLVAKVPHSDEECHWHQDEAYYYRDTPETKSDTRMSVWIPFQRSDERNGCLWIVPRSHRWGLTSHHRVDYGQCRTTLDRRDQADKEAVPVPVEAGDAVLFSALTWHHSKGNATDRVRRAFIISYQEATVGEGGGGQWEILRPAG